MRKNLPGCRIDLLLDALGELGYRRISFDESRKTDGFHIVLHETRTSIGIHIHRNSRYHWKSRTRGKDLEAELKTTLQAYKRLMTTKGGEKINI